MKFAFLLLVLVASAAVATNLTPIVFTTSGPIIGTVTVTGQQQYLGVPFAAPPTGNNRWKTTQSPRPWLLPRFTTKHGSKCPQMDFIQGIMSGSEDCLYLSVYVPPGCSEKNPCPVMQWIYGGAWIIGSDQDDDPTNLAQKYGVVVVAGNYRLDALGWVGLEELQQESKDGSYGNYGLHDQRAAMAWTQHNIAKFGGDPNQVTIFGESAGGWSVCQHLVSPASNGLFSKAIIESADCDGPWTILDGDDAKNFGDAYMKDVGCKDLSGSQRLSCLRKLPVNKVLMPYLKWFCLGITTSNPFCNKPGPGAGSSTALQNTMDQLQSGNLTRRSVNLDKWPTPLPPFAPIITFPAMVDGVTLPDVPLHLIQQGKINRSPKGEKIKVIMGTNHDEMALFIVAMPLIMDGARLPVRNQDIDVVAKHLTYYHNFWNATTAQQIVAAYPEAGPDSIYKVPGQRLTAAGTDFVFRCGTRTAVRALRAQGIDTYLYQFNYHFSGYKDPGSEFCQLDSEITCGVYHASELKFVFNKTANLKTAEDHTMAGYMGAYWTNFAKYGNPNGDGSDGSSVPVQWPKYTEAEDAHLEIANPVSVGHNLAKETCDFWDTLPRQGAYPFN